jgi:ABC-type branched-subunit amino acid transport system substrate-binding protein
VAVLAVAALAGPAACGGPPLAPAAVRAANDAVAGQAAGSSGGTVGATTGGTTGTGAGTTGGSTGSTGSTTTGGSTGSTGGGGSTGSGSSTAAGGAATSGGGSGSSGGGTATSATGGVSKGNCAGFKNQPGITAKTISIGNSSDISGPVPGLFSSAQQATKAYVAYFNATSDICGRKLQLDTYDSRTDGGADQQAYQKICAADFAAVGSMSAFDSGGAPTAQQCGLPDIRTAAVTHERNACTTCFGVQAANTNEFENAVPDFFVKNYHDASQHAAFLYLNAGAAAQNAATQIAAEKQRGMKFLYTAGIDVSEFNYGPYVQKMKSAGVKWVQFLGSYQSFVRLAQAMQQAAFKPQVMLGDPTIYDPGFVQSGGSAVDGAMAFIDFLPFEDAASSKEMQTYLQWLQQVAPGAQPTFFGLFAWSAARLFVQEATQLGGKLTRASLVQAMKGVTAWTDNGLHAAQPVGPKHNAQCWRFLQLKSGHWVPTGGSKYYCNGVSSVG